MVKRCSWGLCNTDNRYPERLAGGVRFIPFPKPKTQREKCQRWIQLCGRPHKQLNVLTTIDHHVYVCSKHFIGGNGPTTEYPDPIPALQPDMPLITRRPPPKRRRILIEETRNTSENETSGGEVPKENHSVLSSESSCQTDGKWISPLDLLSLAVENEQLKIALAKSELEKEDLRRNEDKLQHEVKQLQEVITREQQHEDRMTVDRIKNSKIKGLFKYYTGFSYVTFLQIVCFLVPGQCLDKVINFTKKISSVKSISPANQLLLVMFKLRKGFHYKDLAFRFCISPQDAATIFKNWINFMYFKFASVPIWPHRDVIKEHMPAKFRKEFPTTMVILDATEIKIQRPSALARQSQCYSDYKSTNTLKGLIGIDPRGSVIFISMLFSGSISDKEITNQCGVLKLLKDFVDVGHLRRNDAVMVDKGFRIEGEINKLGLKLNIPPFTSASSQMSESDVKQTRKIAQHRVHVERAIARIKQFKILSHRIDLSLFTCINQIWYVCAFLTNFHSLLIQDT